MIDLPSPNDSPWLDLADRVLSGHAISAEEGLALLRAPDEELLEILAAAYRVRRRYFGNAVHLNFLINAKSGHCGEDCGYCSQSRVSTAEIPKYNLVEPEKILDGARITAELGARTYCIVLSGRTPGERELDVLAEAVPQIKRRHRLAVCASVGLLTPGQAAKIAAAGIDRVNHNLNASRRFYPQICSTHSYDQRLATLEAVGAAGLEICSGGIVGMGEDETDVVDLALQLGRLAVEATPINFLQPIPGTPLAGIRRLNPRYCLKALCLFRLSNPKCELRIAAGREMHLGPLQPLGLYAANSIFVGDYLTTAGQPPSEDFRMIEALGFTAVK
ncbi:MAG: biotin synthase BioB [Pirellulales bacterium]|nr:biotin synthase BioB [Pirellulales bacterium]